MLPSTMSLSCSFFPLTAGEEEEEGEEGEVTSTVFPLAADLSENRPKAGTMSSV